ncbi:MAG: hypothetical protein AAF755_02970 [Pseudomonadota bacterium]
MLSIYAKTFMTATRAPHVRLGDLPSAKKSRWRWFGFRYAVEDVDQVEGGAR